MEVIRLNRVGIRELLLLFFFLTLGCEPIQHEEVDTQPPTVNITNPSEGEILDPGTTVKITVEATDNKKVWKVEFYIDEYNNPDPRYTDYSEPWVYSWRVPQSIIVNHYIKAKAYDSAGNTGSQEICVQIKQ
jgi:hypothetical protein